MLCEDIQWQVSLHCYHFWIKKDIQYQENLYCYHICIMWRYTMPGKSILRSLLYCVKISNARKAYIAIIFVLFKDIQCQESLHCYHFYIVRRQPMPGKPKFLSLLYCAKTTNARKVSIAITLSLCEDFQCQESLHCYHFWIIQRHQLQGKSSLLSFLYSAKTSNARKVYIDHFCCVKISNDRKVYIAITFVFKKTSNTKKVYIAITFVLCEYI